MLKYYGYKDLYKSPFKLSKKGLCYFVITLIITILGYHIIGYLNNGDVSYTTVQVCTMIAVVLMAFQYITFAKYSGSFVSNYAIFLIAFMVFHFGLFFVFSLGGKYNFFYLKRYEISTVLKTIQYEFGGVGAFFIAGAWVRRIKPFEFNKMNMIPKNIIFKTANFFMLITGLIAFLLLVLKVLAFATGYYEGVRQFDARVPSIIGLIEYFFVPFAILTLIYSESGKKDKIISTIVIIWSLITAILGDRTSGLAGILTVMIINFRFKGNEKKKAKKYLMSIIIVFLVAFLINFIKAFREGNAFSSSGALGLFSDVLGELGSSFFPLILIMRICPQNHNFLYGSSYLYSVLSGFIPSSLDPTGIIRMWNAKAIEPLNWITTEYDYTYGTGYSLCAEAYANFGYWGFFSLFIIGIIVIKLLATSEKKLFSRYTSMVLMFEFFTLPRRNFYYVINHPFYCIVIVTMIILIFTRKYVKNNNLYE